MHPLHKALFPPSVSVLPGVYNAATAMKLGHIRHRHSWARTVAVWDERGLLSVWRPRDMPSRTCHPEGAIMFSDGGIVLREETGALLRCDDRRMWRRKKNENRGRQSPSCSGEIPHGIGRRATLEYSGRKNTTPSKWCRREFSAGGDRMTMKNIEFKTRVEGFREIVRHLKKSGAKPEGALKQVDTYFECPSGKLKLRVVDGREWVLIAYHRPAKRGSRTSTYTLLTLTQPQARSLASILARTLGILTSVRKTRILWVHGNTRIHLDTVTTLGRFVELETVMRGSSLDHARREHRRVLSLLHLENAVPIAGSYGDMISGSRAPRARSGQRGSQRSGDADRGAPQPCQPIDGVRRPAGPMLRRAGVRSMPNATSSGARTRPVR